MFCFVYGTLKKGYRNDRYLRNAKFVQNATTKPKYRMYDCGHYPCMVEDKNGVAIEGEVYEINEEILKGLDYLEGYPDLYDRHEIELQDFDKPTLAYFYNGNVGRFKDAGTRYL
jgi:gamma-glutamylcyclotransferase (GGCT)/AIG2-like uncharacterized protein YtfP